MASRISQEWHDERSTAPHGIQYTFRFQEGLDHVQRRPGRPEFSEPACAFGDRRYPLFYVGYGAQLIRLDAAATCEGNWNALRAFAADPQHYQALARRA